MRSYILHSLLVAALAVCNKAYSDTVSTWNGGTGNWSAASNWTPATVPNNSGANTYTATINTGSDAVTLDVSPTLNSLIVGGATGSSLLQTGSSPPVVLMTLGDLTVNKSGGVEFGASFGTGPSGSEGSLAIGGNLKNSGDVSIGTGDISVAKNLTNLGSLFVTDFSVFGNHTFTVGETLTNQGRVTIGGGIGCCGPAGPTTNIGSLVNNGSFSISRGTSVTLTNQPNGITDIPSGSLLDVAGTFTAGANDALYKLASIEGNLILDAGNPVFVNTSSTFTISSSGGLVLADGRSLTVPGTIDNSGSVLFSFDERASGANVLSTGAFINRAGGTLSVAGPFVGNGDSMNASALINYGTASFGRYSLSSVAAVQNGGSVTITGSAGATTAMGLTVGSGIPAGQLGYQQFSSGTLTELISSNSSFGTISSDGVMDLDGILNIMLAPRYIPSVGQQFNFLAFAPGMLSGTFSGIDGDVFDNGLEHFDVTYNNAEGFVALTAVAGAAPTPEPANVLLCGLALSLALLRLFRRKRLV